MINTHGNCCILSTTLRNHLRRSAYPFIATGIVVLFSVACTDSLEERVEQLVDRMTLDEKLEMINGDGFNIAPVDRLGIPAINMSDASMGLRITPTPQAKGLEPSTAFPSSILLAATWNPEQAARQATAIAEEFRARGIHVLLGPGVNIHRHPWCGRNYEYMGEDPYLVSRMVVSYINAVKAVGVLPVIKHFVANNSEARRKNSNSVVSERALREIYFPAFKAAVQEAQVPGLMNAYNLLNGTYCGEDAWLLKEVLREEWGFRGMVVSDWTSIWNSELAANSGVDIEMPGGGKIMAPEKMKALLATGKVTPEEIDDKVRNILRSCIRMGFLDNPFTDPSLNRLEEHAQVALETARQGIVLLKNEGSLPLEPQITPNIVVIGPTAKKTPTTGGGSGAVRPENPVSIYQAIREIYPNAHLLQEVDDKAISAADAVIVCVGLNEHLAIRDYRISNEQWNISAEKAAFIEHRDLIEGEGRNRTTSSLPAGQNELIAQCAALHSNVTVMVTAGGAVDMMPWIDEVEALLWLFYPGQNGARAAAEIVAGRINPSGKLPATFEKRVEDHWSHKDFGLSWSGNDGKKVRKAGVREYQDVVYEEGIFVGYRHFDQADIEPLFCFGHGLSYTRFSYEQLQIIPREDNRFKVQFRVANTGDYKGAEVAQLYVHDVQCSQPRPPKELKGFKKVLLNPGESKTIELTLEPSAFSFWSDHEKAWVLESGMFEILVGASSRDIRLKGSLSVSRTADQ